MEVVWSTRSVNGRWGCDIVSSAEGIDLTKPCRGTLVSLGKAGRIHVFRFEPDDSVGTWILAGGDIEPAAGGATAWEADLQSHARGAILVLGHCAIVRWWGFKRRRCSFALFVRGVEHPTPDSVLLAAGLIEPDEAPVAIPAPPPISGALQDALRRAGLVE